MGRVAYPENSIDGCATIRPHRLVDVNPTALLALPGKATHFKHLIQLELFVDGCICIDSTLCLLRAVDQCLLGVLEAFELADLLHHLLPDGIKILVL